ncbi:MAG: Spx/MgsR family RNA polymerase-binding regulatory protein [Ignavibacteriae bacterium]|nr:Spx/MgsR family RNA polymerase-binding regulatory protein [Ignavibacteriota bacterium]
MAKKNSVEIWGIPTCGTVKKTIAWMIEHGVEFEFRNLRETPPSQSLLQSALASVSHPKKMLNTSGASYRDGGWSAKAASLSGPQIIEALLADPMLIKRPIVRSSKLVTVGFQEDEWAALL